MQGDPDDPGRTRRIALTSEGILVDLSTGRERPAVTGEDFVRTGAFGSDGRHLAVADLRGRVTLWDLRGPRRLAVLQGVGPGAREPVLAFSRDGSLFAASTAGGSVLVWETAYPRLAPATIPVGDGPDLATGLTVHDGALHVTTPHLLDRTSPLTPVRSAAEVCERAGGGATRAEWRRYLPCVPYRATCDHP
ncbi:hypothetical protein ABT124_40370 [Streptomyces sp. NPDC001982]|uniref:WD40 repeat domain-containing protein n=1 Tax=Streptomyces sp. NPDC001982 TaxID=3154405 RepID=UPI00331E0EFC